MTGLDQRVIVPIDASHPELGRWLWAMQDTRARTKVAVAGLTPAELDFTSPGVANSIGSLLYHIALIEADYLYVDILGIDYPEWLEELFPWPHRDERGHLSVVTGLSIEAHLARLDRVRDEFVRLVGQLSADQIATARQPAGYDYEISPAWTLHHLMQHEAEHRGQITVIRDLQAR